MPGPVHRFAKLVWWRMEVARLYDSKPEHPVTQALQAVLPQFSLPQELVARIIDGMDGSPAAHISTGRA